MKIVNDKGYYFINTSNNIELIKKYKMINKKHQHIFTSKVEDKYFDYIDNNSKINNQFKCKFNIQNIKPFKGLKIKHKSIKEIKLLQMIEKIDFF
jgi:hypothetical protein